ncbi:MAG: chromosomal replication initiator protein DnaA [Hyphomicrobiales bacterium]|nr:chromosomal replication initiator protein DnaA [Hyphomicrobiales bacterium]
MTKDPDVRDEWERIKARLRVELGEDVFTSWFARVEFESLVGDAVHLSVPTRFLKNWLQSRYRDRLLALFRESFGAIAQIEFSVRSAFRPAAGVGEVRRPQPVLVAANPEPRGAAARPAAAAARLDDELAGSPLDARHTFETFVEGRSNSLALAAARRVADVRPGEPVAFNPLYLHAAVGLGKTHLLQAVAQAARAEGRKVLYLTAEHFMYRFVQALMAQSAIAFKEALRGIDLLLIDDMQFLQGKQVQQEFCHTLNSLIDGARQVVIAADRPAADLETLDERVRSRLAGGLLVEIGAPDVDLRRRIVARRVEAAKKTDPTLEISAAVIDWVAENVVSSGRDLDGAVNRLVAHNQLTGSRIDLEMAEAALRDLLRAREPKKVKIEDIQRVVSKHFNVTKADLLSARRTRTVVRPRQIAMYLAKALTPRSLPEIGRRFGNRDHTTVLHAVRKIEEMATADRGFADEIEMLKRLLDA